MVCQQWESLCKHLARWCNGQHSRLWIWQSRFKSAPGLCFCKEVFLTLRFFIMLIDQQNGTPVYFGRSSRKPPDPLSTRRCLTWSLGKVTAVGFEPTPLRTGAWSQRLRPLGQTVLLHVAKRAVTMWRTRRSTIIAGGSTKARSFWYTSSADMNALARFSLTLLVVQVVSG